MRDEIRRRLLASRAGLAGPPQPLPRRPLDAEGGCGVIGLACSEQVPGRHLLRALEQMRNRGNGKGGGIAAAGLVPEQMGVSRQVLDQDYLVAVAYLEPPARAEVERDFLEPHYQVDQVREMPHLEDYRTLAGLEVRPPEVVAYFVRPRPQAVERFRTRHGLEAAEAGAVEDELVYQTSYRLNQAFYSATGRTRAFVLSHGKNLLVLKMVGYGDDVVRYYQLEDLRAHVWIGHHRYPTKGRVWHPGGAHPFVGLHEALVHNGDFANYASVVEYLAQRHIRPLFLTDTEVSVLIFDLLHRTCGYPLEYVIEALAPTTERDFALLDPERQRLYQALQQTHIHGSPDGPWFFLIAQSLPQAPPVYRLIGITDTSMLRPQVFALQGSPQGPSIGLAASEKQARDAALASLAAEDSRFWSRPDRIWNARGGSHTDGGAFLFTVREGSLVCTDKFGRRIAPEFKSSPPSRRPPAEVSLEGPGEAIFSRLIRALPDWDEEFLDRTLERLVRQAPPAAALEALTLLVDRRYPLGGLRRSRVLSLVDRHFADLVETLRQAEGFAYVEAGARLPAPAPAHTVAILDARGYPPEGPESAARQVVRLVQAGFRRLAVVHTRGHRFLGNGLGSGTRGLRLDIYGSPGDYLASGIDGIEIHVHAYGQDQLAQIMRSGTLVIHGDVGQTFMYGAKGGRAFILGDAAGRPLINAVGRPRVVINGTCLDYLAESFMAGDPHDGGGFVVLNGLAIDDEGGIHERDTPYPGGNLFSLASGGAILVRDPFRRLSEDQLNGGEFAPFTQADWELIRPYLEENERHLAIPVARLLEVEGQARPPDQVYRKIRPGRVKVLQAEEAWVHKAF
jgi:glutamate synthase domain-containing protein 1/glutamate synthase domain-containing protein 3